jgi:hypothetical protein
MPKKLIALAIVVAALAAPSSASALQPVVHTTATRIPHTNQYEWTCTARALPPITSFTLWCNGVKAVGTAQVQTISGVGTGSPQVCWDGSFRWGSGLSQNWANFDGCRYGEHLV